MKVLKKSRRFPVRMLPLDRLLPTSDNRRRPITQKSVDSLAKSILRDGVIQPIVVRPHPEKDGHWEIRAGERRWRAAKLAGLAEVPAVVRDLDDESALSVTIAENLQRQGLHPLEEAATIQQAFDRGYEPKAMAARLGKSVAYIARRASLTRLSQEWRDEVLRPDSEAGRLSVAHLELIARLPEETQQLLAENQFHRVFARGFPTVAELQRLIDPALASLRVMPWPLDDETLDPKAGACLSCPKRSGMRPMLFEPEDAPQDGKVSKTDRCLDPLCFERKHLAFVERRESELRAEHPTLRLVQIGYGTLSVGARHRFGDRLTQVYTPKFVKPSSAHAVPAMQIDGPKTGALVYMDLGDRASGDVSRGKGAKRTDASGKPLPMPLVERKARLQKRRDAFLVQRVAESLRAVTPEVMTRTAAELAKRTDQAAKRFDPLALVLAFGTSTRADREHDDGPWKRYAELLDRKHDLPIVAALQEVAQVWTRRLGGSDTHHVTEQAADARKVCELLGFDATAIESEAEQTIPTPKSWASLSDDGATAKEEAPFDVPPVPASRATKARRGRRASKTRQRSRG